MQLYSCIAYFKPNKEAAIKNMTMYMFILYNE